MPAVAGMAQRRLKENAAKVSVMTSIIKNELLRDLIHCAQQRLDELKMRRNKRQLKSSIDHFQRIVDEATACLPDEPEHRIEGTQAHLDRFVAGDR